MNPESHEKRNLVWIFWFSILLSSLYILYLVSTDWVSWWGPPSAPGCGSPPAWCCCPTHCRSRWRLPSCAGGGSVPCHVAGDTLERFRVWVWDQHHPYPCHTRWRPPTPQGTPRLHWKGRNKIRVREVKSSSSCEKKVKTISTIYLT